MVARSALARRYAAWIVRRRRWIIIGSIVIAALTGALASRLSVFADFSYLLPSSVRSVRDLRAIEQRARSIGTATVAVRAPSPELRERAAGLARAEISALPPTLVAEVKFDDHVQRQYAWDHRWLFAPLPELERARDALRERIDRAKLAANPLFVPLDEPGGDDAGLAELQRRLRDAEVKATGPAELVAQKGPLAGRLQILVIRTAFASGEVELDRRLLGELERVRADVERRVPGVQVGIAGDVVVSVAEHDSILHGMLLATAVTLTLVLAALIWFFRSAIAIGALSWSLVVGTLATFAFAKLALGYLNLATAFLSSIVIGNGINVGILVTARYLEELRAGKDGAEAIAGAIEGTIAGTLAAALTAAVAYASLVITVFRGFRHFGIIGGVGILLCWVSAYTVLPAALAIARGWGMRPRKPAPLGHWLARLLPKNLAAVAIGMLVLVVAAAAITVAYLAGDPFESNFRNLRSQSPAIAVEHAWRHQIDEAFGQGMENAFVIAVPARDDARRLEQRLRAVDAGKPPRERLFGEVVSLDDVLPQDQTQKLAVLAQIRALLSSHDLAALDAGERAQLARLRPPADLRPLGDADVPAELAAPFIERDGSRGKLLLATAGPSYEVWNAHDVVRFVQHVRALGLPADYHLGGETFVFADVLEAVLTDGPRATLASIAGAVLVVLLVVGVGRHAAVALACGASGTLLMLAAAALLGLKINFLDFVALPITVGIGIEYAVNITTRARQVGPDHVREALATTGAAVALCSYTTIVGYGSLLLSQNQGIRSFGLAAMLGEITCLGVAIVLAPALLSSWAARSAAGTPGPGSREPPRPSSRRSTGSDPIGQPPP